MNTIIRPYGGELKQLIVDAADAEFLKSESESYPTIVLTRRQECDLEMFLNGALSPLEGFMNEDVYQSVINDARLPDGTLWPMPFYLDVDEPFADGIEVGSKVALRDTEGFMPAVLTVESIWHPDKKRELETIYGTDEINHPGVAYVTDKVKKVYIGGSIEGVQLPFHYDFETLRHTPEETRNLFSSLGWRRVVGFQTSKPMHKVHMELTLRAAIESEANILLHPVVGMSKPGDIQYYARVHCYQAIMKHYPKDLVALSLVPMALRMAGPREALMNAIIRQNYGCSHYIIGNEHAAPPNTRNDDGQRFYGSGESQDYVLRHQDELDIDLICMGELRYDTTRKKYVDLGSVENGDTLAENFTGRQVLDALSTNDDVPDWVTYREVLDELRKVCPPRHKVGLTLFFTGLSGSGKSTLARIMHAKFIEQGDRSASLLDGDIVRHNLSSELGFSREDRNINVKRIGFVASEITKNGGVAICAPIAPYLEMRRSVREIIEQYGRFIEIHVATPIEVCEARDRKGLYAKARKGLIPEFTGISDPYDIPERPEIRIDTTDMTPLEAAHEVYLYLFREGYLKNVYD